MLANMEHSTPFLKKDEWTLPGLMSIDKGVPQ